MLYLIMNSFTSAVNTPANTDNGAANAVVAPAIEFRNEGLVSGVGAKMFIIAGPVIVYGMLASVMWGVIYHFIRPLMGG